MSRSVKLCLVAAASAAVCFLACSTYVMEAHALPVDLIAKIERGDSESDVKKLFGDPARISASESGATWVYSGLTWCYVVVHFDSNGLVDRVVHDH